MMAYSITAPYAVAILIAVGSGIAIQHTIIALPLLATKLMGEARQPAVREARQPVAIKSLIDEEKIGKKEKAGRVEAVQIVPTIALKDVEGGSRSNSICRSSTSTRSKFSSSPWSK